MISVQPIVDYMNARDLTVFDCFPNRQEEWAARHGAIVQRHVTVAEFRPAVKRWGERLRDARNAGVIDPYVADEFCCKLLQRHPCEVYGREWFEEAAA